MSRRRSRDEDDVTDDEPSSASSQGSKRRRLSRQDEGEGDGLLPDSFRRSPRGNRTSRIADEKHQPGSLVRITVKNFVTYTKATFNCGPSLNMIIGPNGTGKSTLVCAICLGLGSKPAVLGRSKDIGEYVKHGHKEAEIEVELAGEEGKTNPIIHHTIKRDGNKSTWRINGQQTTHKQVITLIRKYNIQIDNLCQFLPQDRVVEFAQMTPIELLESTQKAAAREQMTQWHMQLKQLGQERLSMQSNNAQDLNDLSSLEKRHAAQQGEVDRIKERQTQKIKLTALELYRPMVEYQTRKTELDEARNNKKQCQREYRALEEQVAPKLQIVNDCKAHLEQLKTSQTEAATILRRFDEETIANKKKAVEAKKQDIEACDIDYTAQVKEHKKRHPEIQKIEQEIRKLKHAHEQEPVAFDAAAFNGRIREAAEAIRAHRAKTMEVKDEEARIKALVTPKKQEWEDAKEELKHLQSAAGQQNAKLKGLSNDSAAAYTWLQRNGHLFKDKIYGPPLVECKTKDPRYAGALESVMGRGDLLCFTATNRDDWKKFLDVCQNQLRIKDVTTRVAARPLSDWQPPVSKDELRGYGLEDFAIDFLQGPEPVLSMLCDAVRLHRTGVSLKDISDAQFDRLQDSQVSSWVAGRNSYRVNRRREYGPGAVSTVVTQVKDPKHWNSGGNNADSDANRQLHERIKGIERELADLEDQNEPIADQLEALRQEHTKLQDEKKAIEDEKADAQTAYSQWLALPRKIETLEEKRQAKQALQDTTRERLEEIRAKKTNLLLERAQLAIDHAIALERGMQMQEEVAEMEIQLLEAESEYGVEYEESERVRNMLEERQREIRRLEEDITHRTDACKLLVRNIRRNQAAVEEMEHSALIEEVQNRWQENLDLDTGEPMDEDSEQRTLEDLVAEIDGTKGRMELLHEGNPHAIEQFEARAKQIEKLKDKIANFEQRLASLNSTILDIRKQWEPELDGIVEQISVAFAHNFERIGCAGQVSVKKDDEDFREWAVQIEVKFRENEELAVLDARRQSGGERAVSTVFYLMALQSLARSPFRVVDEINQGMDPRNERMVHERMVDIACSENTSQYFLVTPKLLNGLKYDPRMVVHIIMSGSEMPANESAEQEGFLDLNKLAARALEAGRVH